MIDIDLSILNKLLEQTKPHWGGMSPQHMVEHLSAAVKMSNGKIVFTECMNPPEKHPILKRFLMSNRPMPKDFVNTVVGKGLKPLINNSLKEAKQELIKELSNFEKYFNENPKALPLNPTFGPLNFEEWKVFHNKHFTHHFTQFGLL